MCVASCPTTSYSPLAAALANVETEAAIKKKVAPFCAPEMASFANLSMKQLVDQSICPAWYLSSAELMGRCLPNISQGDEFEAVEVNQTKLEQGQECYRVLVSLISWPGQLLSLNPCRRPKILARMLFWGFCL